MTTEDALPPLCSLIPFTTHPSQPRRLATALLLRNLAFTHPRPLSLLQAPISLLSHILLPLIGPDPPFTDEETDQLLPELQYLGPEQVRESNPEILKEVLEALYLLITRGDIEGAEKGCGHQGRKVVKDAGTYLVIRELHLVVDNEEVRENCEKLVDVLMSKDVESTEGKARVEDLGYVKEGDNDEEDKVIEIF